MLNARLIIPQNLSYGSFFSVLCSPNSHPFHILIMEGKYYQEGEILSWVWSFRGVLTRWIKFRNTIHCYNPSDVFSVRRHLRALAICCGAINLPA